MTRYLLTIFIAALSCVWQTCHAEEMWTARKLAHLTGSAALAGVATDLTGSQWEGGSIAFAAGFAKEGLDAYRRRHRGGQDKFTCHALVADAIGSAIGAKLGGLYLNHQGHTTVVAYSGSF